MQILFSGSDYEGRIGFVRRAFADLRTTLLNAGYIGEIPQLIEDVETGEQKFIIPDNFIFGQLGDVIDHGKYDIRMQRALINANNTFTLIGNRDSNKIRMLIECRDKSVMISNAILNNIGAWDSDNHNRRNPNNCLLAILIKNLQETDKDKFEIINNVLTQYGFNSLQEFLLQHVTPAQQTFQRIPVAQYSRNYILARDKIAKILDEIEFKELQKMVVKWNLDYTMGSAPGKLWDGSWNNRKAEIKELHKQQLTEQQLETLVVDSYVNSESPYNLALNYLQKSAIAKRIGNVISVHGCLTANSFKFPDTELNIESFTHIDEWINKINTTYQESLYRVINGEELQKDDLAVFSYAIRFGLGGGRSNVNFLQQEYENQIRSFKALPETEQINFISEIKRLEKMLARLEILERHDGIGSIIGNNHYLKVDGQILRDEFKELGFKLDKSIIDLFKRSGIEAPVIQVGHAPTGDAGLAGAALYEDSGKLKKSNINIFSIDPTYADQNGTSLLTLTVFSDSVVSKTIIISRRNADSELEYSAIDANGNRRKIDANSLSLVGTELQYNFMQEVYFTFKDVKSTSFETVLRKDTTLTTPKP